jgi:hypothetical protein
VQLLPFFWYLTTHLLSSSQRIMRHSHFCSVNFSFPFPCVLCLLLTIDRLVTCIDIGQPQFYHETICSLKTRVFCDVTHCRLLTCHKVWIFINTAVRVSNLAFAVQWTKWRVPCLFVRDHAVHRTSTLTAPICLCPCSGVHASVCRWFRRP